MNLSIVIVIAVRADTVFTDTIPLKKVMISNEYGISMAT